MKILITGVHGFVGSNLVNALSKEHAIYGLDIINPSRDGVVHTFSWDEIDMVNGEGLMVNGSPVEVDAIIHLAGKAHDTKNESKAEVYFKVNTELTKKIYDYFLAHEGIKKFIFFSTAKAAADRVEGVLTEDVVPKPVGPYGESKIKAEEYIMRSLHDGRDDNDARNDKGDGRNDKGHTDSTDNTDGHPERSRGISEISPCATLSRNDKEGARNDNKSVYIFRPCMIHGPGNKGNLNLLYNMVKKGIPWPLGAFENRRTFTSVENICFAVNGVLTKDVPSGIYNMGDDEALSTNELIEEICKSLGKKARIWKLPKGLMTMFASLGGLLHLPLNPDRLQKLTENYVSSNAKIKKALGVDRMPVDAREGLRRTLKSFEE